MGLQMGCGIVDLHKTRHWWCSGALCKRWKATSAAQTTPTALPCFVSQQRGRKTCYRACLDVYCRSLTTALRIVLLYVLVALVHSIALERNDALQWNSTTAGSKAFVLAVEQECLSLCHFFCLTLLFPRSLSSLVFSVGACRSTVAHFFIDTVSESERLFVHPSCGVHYPILCSWTQLCLWSPCPVATVGYAPCSLT